MDKWKWYVCRACGHEVYSQDQPQTIKWTDGHVCHFTEKEGLTTMKEDLEQRAHPLPLE